MMLLYIPAGMGAREGAEHSGEFAPLCHFSREVPPAGASSLSLRVLERTRRTTALLSWGLVRPAGAPGLAAWDSMGRVARAFSPFPPFYSGQNRGFCCGSRSGLDAPQIPIQFSPGSGRRPQGPSSWGLGGPAWIRAVNSRLHDSTATQCRSPQLSLVWGAALRPRGWLGRPLYSTPCWGFKADIWWGPATGLGSLGPVGKAYSPKWVVSKHEFIGRARRRSVMARLGPLARCLLRSSSLFCHIRGSFQNRFW